MKVVYPRLNNVIATIPRLRKLWFVETYVTIKKPLVEDFYNILRFVAGNIGSTEHGKRLPAIFIRKSNTVLFNVDRITTSGSHNIFDSETPIIFNVGVRFHVRVEQVVNSSGQHYIRVYLNHVRIKHLYAINIMMIAPAYLLCMGLNMAIYRVTSIILNKSIENCILCPILLFSIEFWYPNFMDALVNPLDPAYIHPYECSFHVITLV